VQTTNDRSWNTSILIYKGRSFIGQARWALCRIIVRHNSQKGQQLLWVCSCKWQVDCTDDNQKKIRVNPKKQRHGRIDRRLSTDRNPANRWVLFRSRDICAKLLEARCSSNCHQLPGGAKVIIRKKSKQNHEWIPSWQAHDLKKKKLLRHTDKKSSAIERASISSLPGTTLHQTTENNNSQLSLYLVLFVFEKVPNFPISKSLLVRRSDLFCWWTFSQNSAWFKTSVRVLTNFFLSRSDFSSSFSTLKLTK
jgi:hypothetical protein